jgi:tRNA threonylcarbamoyladenosine biosynthesis protein TsaB
MKLYIDTSKREKTILRFDDLLFESDTTHRKSAALISFIEECLVKQSKKISDVSEIEVMSGPGSFTGLRVGVSVAQALGWSLQVPVNGMDLAKKEYIDIQY